MTIKQFGDTQHKETIKIYNAAYKTILIKVPIKIKRSSYANAWEDRVNEEKNKLGNPKQVETSVFKFKF